MGGVIHINAKILNTKHEIRNNPPAGGQMFEI